MILYRILRTDVIWKKKPVQFRGGEVNRALTVFVVTIQLRLRNCRLIYRCNIQQQAQHFFFNMAVKGMRQPPHISWSYCVGLLSSPQVQYASSLSLTFLKCIEEFAVYTFEHIQLLPIIRWGVGMQEGFLMIV